jgi:hypothetical protein
VFNILNADSAFIHKSMGEETSPLLRPYRINLIAIKKKTFYYLNSDSHLLADARET